MPHTHSEGQAPFCVHAPGCAVAGRYGWGGAPWPPPGSNELAPTDDDVCW